MEITTQKCPCCEQGYEISKVLFPCPTCGRTVCSLCDGPHGDCNTPALEIVTDWSLHAGGYCIVYECPKCAATHEVVWDPGSPEEGKLAEKHFLECFSDPRNLTSITSEGLATLTHEALLDATSRHEEDETHEIHTLPRTGNRPLEFEGEPLAEASSHSHDGATSARWHELAIYRTGGGKYVVAIGYRTRWQGEHNHDEVLVEDTAEGAAEIIRSTVPTTHLIGYPLGEQYAEKQARIERAICAAYEAAASEVLAALGPERIE